MLAGEAWIPLAGGTDLMVRHRPAGGTVARFPLPLLAVGHLEALHGIRENDGFLEIGAACTLTAFLQSPLVPEGWKPPVAGMASPAIRNVGTIGGNIGNASPAGDTLPLLVALDAQLILVSASGSRTLPVADFITGPGRTQRRPDELLKAVRVPMPVRDRSYWYRKVGPRRANCLSKVSLFGWWETGDGHLTDCGVALGAVAPVVVRNREAEALLAGGAVVPTGRGSAGLAASYRDGFLQRMMPGVQPIDDQRSTADYRREVARRLLAEWLDVLR